MSANPQIPYGKIVSYEGYEFLIATTDDLQIRVRQENRIRSSEMNPWTLVAFDMSIIEEISAVHAGEEIVFPFLTERPNSEAWISRGMTKLESIVKSLNVEKELRRQNEDEKMQAEERRRFQNWLQRRHDDENNFIQNHWHAIREDHRQQYIKRQQARRDELDQKYAWRVQRRYQLARYFPHYPQGPFVPIKDRFELYGNN